MLTRLDAAIAGLQLGALATVLIGRLEQSAADRAAGSTACAGPVPGTCRRCRGARRDAATPDDAASRAAPRRRPARRPPEREVVLEQGSTLLLYTDGLVERRDQAFDDGIDVLGRALAEERDRPVEEVCDALLRRCFPDGAEDDVALVAVRLLPRAEGDAGAR